MSETELPLEHNDRASVVSSTHGTAVSPMRSTTSSHRMSSAIAKLRRVSRSGVWIRSTNFCGRIRRFFPIRSKRSSFWSPKGISSLHGPPTRARSGDQWAHFHLRVAGRYSGHSATFRVAEQNENLNPIGSSATAVQSLGDSPHRNSADPRDGFNPNLHLSTVRGSTVAPSAVQHFLRDTSFPVD